MANGISAQAVTAAPTPIQSSSLGVYFMAWIEAMAAGTRCSIAPAVTQPPATFCGYWAIMVAAVPTATTIDVDWLARAS